MKRRTAIQGIIAASAGAALLPACNFFQEPLKVYANLPLDRAQRGLIDQLSNTLLPTAKIEGLTTLEPTLDFMLGMLNDCYPKEEVDKYLTGFTAFQTHLKEKYQSSFSKLPAEKATELISELQTSETIPEELKYFFSTTKQLTQKHFTSSEYYQKKYLDFEFAPARYEGCASI